MPAGLLRSTRVAIAGLQSLAHESRVDVSVDEPQQMIFRNVVFDSEVVE